MKPPLIRGGQGHAAGDLEYAALVLVACGCAGLAMGVAGLWIWSGM